MCLPSITARLTQVRDNFRPVLQRVVCQAPDVELSGMAYATPSAETLPLSEITSVEVWNNAMDNHKKVPSVKSYSHPSERGEEQWGSDLSPDAISMVHTKLELHQQNVSDELNLILQALEGMDDLKFDSLKQREVAPGYSDKSAEEIVTDFLVHVFQAFDDARAADLIPQDLLSKFPTTIVATVPTVRSDIYRCKARSD